MAIIYKFPPSQPDYLLNQQLDLYILADKILAEAIEVHKKSIHVIASAIKIQQELIKMMSETPTKH